MKTAQILKLVLIVAILFAVFRLVSSRSSQWNVQPYSFEAYGEGDDSDAEEDSDPEDDDADDDDEEDVEGFSNANPAEGGWASGAPMMNVASDLLPKSMPKAQNFAEFAPKSLLGQNFLDAKKYIGVDTQGSSLRNANYDLRSSPSIPRRDVGPWAQSTIDGDLYRKPLE